MKEIFRIIPVSFPCFSEFILYAHSYLWALFKSLTVPSLTIYLLANWRLFHKHNKLFVNHRWSLNAWKKKIFFEEIIASSVPLCYFTFCVPLSQFNSFRTFCDTISFRCDSTGTNLYLKNRHAVPAKKCKLR